MGQLKTVSSGQKEGPGVKTGGKVKSDGFGSKRGGGSKSGDFGQKGGQKVVFGGGSKNTPTKSR